MPKNLTTVREGGNQDLLKSSQPQKLYSSFQNKNIKRIKAFSLAEAMIALLIGTIVLGMSAPVITKSLKNGSIANIQLNILGKRINNLEDINANTRLNTLEGYNAKTRLTNLEGIKADSRLKKLEKDLNKLLGDNGSISLIEKDLDYLLGDNGSISSLESRISTLEKQNTNNNKIAELEKKVQSLVKFENFPKGSLVFTFGSCPNATYWQDVTSNYTNAFIKASTTSIGTVQNPSGNIPEHYHYVGSFTQSGNNDADFVYRTLTTKYAYTERSISGEGRGGGSASVAKGAKSYSMTTGQELIYPSNATKNSTYQPKNVAVRVCKKI